MKPMLVIDGDRSDDFEGFAREVGAQLLGGEQFNGNLDAFNDILRGGFGTPPGGFGLRWVNSERSRAALGHAATARWYEAKLKTCDPSNLRDVQERLASARRGEGPTLFDAVVDIIRAHGPGGVEGEDGVLLELA
jgi:hypothetical protein